MPTNYKGPFWDGRTERLVSAFIEDAEKTIGDEALAEVHEGLKQNLKHPTGHYQSRIRVDMRAGDPVIHDGGIVYGPWLEGVGSRNRTTRFKGYFTFKRAKEIMKVRAPEIARRVLKRYIGGM